MGRPSASRPTYYASRGGYFCWHEGRQLPLAYGAEKDARVIQTALAEFKRLKEQGTVPGAGPDTLVIRILDRYCFQFKPREGGKGNADTYRVRKRLCQDFIGWTGKHAAKNLQARDMTPRLVQDWIDSHPTWGEGGSKFGAVSCMKAAMQFAVNEGTLETNPLKKMVNPKCRSRGKECVVSAGHHAILLAECHKRRMACFADLLTALWETGARIGELRKATADELKCVNGTWLFDLKEWKTKKAGIKERLILVSEELLPIVQRLAKEHTEGPLFRNRRGKGWTVQGVVMMFWRWRERLGLPKKLSAYGYRHAFATRWVNAGLNLLTLANIMGTSIKMIERHYCHHDVASMFAALRDFKASS